VHDPYTVVYSNSLFTLWHKDPVSDGTDDSCGWFMRARHGDLELVEEIAKAYEFDWDRIFTYEETGEVYECGYFRPDGDPHLSVMAVTLNLFWKAAYHVFGKSHRKAKKYLNKHLFEILHFAENPTDSLHESLTQKFGPSEDREERIKSLTRIIYAQILRDIRPWWKHPRWHVHHWRISLHGRLKRFGAGSQA